MVIDQHGYKDISPGQFFQITRNYSPVSMLSETKQIPPTAVSLTLD